MSWRTYVSGNGGRQGRTEQVGFIVAAFSLGGLTAPLWGLADRHRLHRYLLAGGQLVAGPRLGSCTIRGVALEPELRDMPRRFEHTAFSRPGGSV